MEHDLLEEKLRKNQLQIWERLMYVALGSAVTIVFHTVNPLRDAILLLTFLYTTLSGFYLLWTIPSGDSELSRMNRKVAFGHLLASWLTVFAIYFYSLLPPLGLVALAYAILLLVIGWRTRRKLAAADQIFP